jgi:hypothetical protein
MSEERARGGFGGQDIIIRKTQEDEHRASYGSSARDRLDVDQCCQTHRVKFRYITRSFSVDFVKNL